MPETTAEVTEMETEEIESAEQEQGEQQEQKPVETVDFWRKQAREQEKRAKAGAAAIKRLAEIDEAGKTEAEKAAEKIAAAKSEIEAVPSKVADALRAHLVKLHGIEAEDVELFLTASDPELLLKQVDRLLGTGKQAKKNYVAREGTNSSKGKADEGRSFAREFFGK